MATSMKPESSGLFLLLISAVLLKGQTASANPAMDYLMTLQRAMAQKPLNTADQKQLFCDEMKKLLSAIRLPPDLQQFSKDPSALCDALLKDTASSPYERADFIWNRRHLEPRVRSALSTLGDKLPQEPILGTIPSPLLNARTFRVRGSGSPVIVLNDSVFRLPYEISRASVDVLGITIGTDGKIVVSPDIEKIKVRLAAQPDLKNRFEIAVLEYLHVPVERLAYAAPTAAATDFGVRLLVGLTETMETFIICHEFAHIIRGHTLGPASSLSFGPSRISSEDGEAWYSWRQEFDADAYGFTILDQVLKQEGDRRYGSYLKDPLYPFFLYGPRFLFATMSVVENADAYIRTGAPAPTPSEQDARLVQLALSTQQPADSRAGQPDASSANGASHPPFVFRFKQIEGLERDALASFQSKAESGADSTYRLSTAFGNVLGALFEGATPDFKQRYRGK